MTDHQHPTAKPEGEGAGVERDYPAEFEVWWANYKHRNRDKADYPVKKQIAFDAFYFAALSASPPVPDVAGEPSEAISKVWRWLRNGMVDHSDDTARRNALKADLERVLTAAASPTPSADQSEVIGALVKAEMIVYPEKIAFDFDNRADRVEAQNLLSSALAAHAASIGGKS